MPPTLSIALGTMNCARYLGPQLESLLAQSMLPDELVVGDEASTDGTRQILADFAKRAPFPVRLLLNERRLGVAANFTQVIDACTGSLTALCDHDDVWETRRLERALLAFEAADVVLSFSDATLLDEASREIPGRLWESLRFDADLQARVAGPEAFRILISRRLATGGTMTLRTDVAKWALPIPPGFFQDEWLALLAPLRGAVKPIPEPLMRYRQHSGNAVGVLDTGWLARARRARDGRRLERLDAELAQLRSVQTQTAKKSGVQEHHRAQLADRIAHVEARMAVQGPPSSRIPALLREFRSGRYAQDSMGYWSALQDLLG